MKKWTTKKSTEIYRVLNGRVNSYLVCHSKGLVLVDCGLNRLSSKMLKNIGKVNPAGKSIDYIFLTHTHFDHCQNTLEISKKLKAKVIVNSFESYDLISGETTVPDGTMWFSKIILKLGNIFINKTPKCSPVEPDLIINHNGTLFESESLKVIHTPGHSSGSMCLIIDDEIALVGDALFGVFPKRAFPPFADDEEELIESWGKLLKTDCSLFLPGHGSAVSRKTLEKEFFKRN